MDIPNKEFSFDDDSDLVNDIQSPVHPTTTTGRYSLTGSVSQSAIHRICKVSNGSVFGDVEFFLRQPHR